MNNFGLFIVSYEITTGLLGAPTLRTNLVVSTPNKTVTGNGHVHNGSVHPAFELDSKLNGEFTYMTVMPNNTHILVTANGTAFTPPTQPIEIPNLKLRMVLEADWSAGTATFDYIGADGQWVTIQNAKVTKVNTVTATPAASVASEALVAQN